MAEGPVSVLLVDDEPLLLEVCADALRLAGHVVTACEAPSAALAALAGTAACDVLVADFLMPEMDGLELAACARALRPGLPVVLATGVVSAALRERAAELGIAAVLTKPYAPGELLLAVARAAARRPA